ncbi:MAG TPA: thermonuclease family protein [Acidimicrobiales bacterium]|nr:thermonuclease family protein [Acidimicrobiales bacterium]
MPRTTLALALALLAGAAGCARPVAVSRPGSGAATVIRVVDGDTIHVRINGFDEPVRLIGIDTPETHGKGGLRECFGAEATERMAALLPTGTSVRLVRDVEARDRYDRLLAYVYRASDGLFVNLAMAEDGYATTLTYPPNVAHTDEFVAAVGTARLRQRGLWHTCGSADVPLPTSPGAATG